jgi:hypothetical protein
MIFTELYKGQGLGNQLFVYASARAIAKKLGQPFGIQSPQNFKAPKLFNLDWGDTIPDEYVIHQEYIHGSNSPLSNPHQGLSLTDKSVFDLTGNVKLEGCYISEGYFHECLGELHDWLKVNPEYEHDDTSDDDLCILNLRGGEMRNTHVYAPRSYWDNAIQRMLEFNSNMKFIVVTDDVDAANDILPEFECYHRDVETENQKAPLGSPQGDSWVGNWDYVAIKNCKNIICSTTTFACFPLWTNKNLKKCISPKYNFCMNHSDGWWCRGDSIFSYVTDYMDNKGNLMSPKECKSEWKEYYLKNNIYSQEDLENNYEF